MNSRGERGPSETRFVHEYRLLEYVTQAALATPTPCRGAEPG
jgi:hypothetical protein